ncbi:MAG: PEP-CTERM sorting domain-containing protein, partial [Phycisphaeraceae bacterium]
TFDTGLTVRGSGDIGNNVLNIINNGAIRATDAVNALILDPTGTFTNNGTIAAEEAAGVQLNGGTFINNGVIRALTGSTFDADGSGVTLTNSPTGTLAGNGTITANSSFVNNGTIAPGNSPGTLTLTTAALVNSDTSVLEIEIAGNGAGLSDLLLVSGTFDVDGLLKVVFLPGAESLLPGDVITIVDASSLVFSDDVGNAFDQVISLVGGNFDVIYNQSAGLIQLTNFSDIVPVPEPSGATLIALGAAGMMIRRRRGTKRDR